MIQAYTCDILDPNNTEENYPSLNQTYSCYCNNGDYHTMPNINLEITGMKTQYDMSPGDYMFLPYLNYTQPLSTTSLCILGIDEIPENRRLAGDIEYASIGQRAMSEFPFYIVFDTDNNSATFALGGATDMNGKGTLGIQISISIAIVIVLFVMLVYLIYLRRNRIKAEEWLEQHKNTLFSHSANLKTEEEILEALVKSKELQDLLNDRNRQGSSNNIGGLGLGGTGNDPQANSGQDLDDDKESGNFSDGDNQLLQP